ncbi:MAG: N-acetylglucosamine-6-phosphate deacetylase, partial [Mesorhizobium sp.]
AGADLDMISAIRFMHRTVGLELSEALRMASLYPAQAIGQSHRLGRFANGTAADIVALSGDLGIGSVWIGGDKVFEAAASR